MKLTTKRTRDVLAHLVRSHDVCADSRCWCHDRAIPAPEALYPEGWLRRADDLKTGRATPQDWWDLDPVVRVPS